MSACQSSTKDDDAINVGLTPSTMGCDGHLGDYSINVKSQRSARAFTENCNTILGMVLDPPHFLCAGMG